MFLCTHKPQQRLKHQIHIYLHTDGLITVVNLDSFKMKVENFFVGFKHDETPMRCRASFMEFVPTKCATQPHFELQKRKEKCSRLLEL